ncbi:MAG TPA: T9SS type A sorting domain-containing protein [Bacteroidia bacterium]|jgi:hypothetical protein|nr:T9SS type A sorting domain-containing protein [Bacteroidia bacterium]
MKGFILIASLFVFNYSFSQIITTIAGNGVLGSSGDGGQATAAELRYPIDVAVDAVGDIYVVDNTNSKIRAVNSAGFIYTVAGNGITGYSGDGGLATGAELSYPTGVALDSFGNIYIADHANERVRKVNKSGFISTIAGNGVYGYSGDGGQASVAELWSPTNVAIDASGNIFIADAANYRIRKVNTSGIISTIAGNGISGFSGDGGPATAAEFDSPYDIAIDAAGNIYVADDANNRIRKIDASGIISTFAGNGYGSPFSGGYSGDGGAATAAELFYPDRVAVDAFGNVYIGDADNDRIRKVNTSGIISTIAGNGYKSPYNGGYSGDGGPATDAELYLPSGIAFDNFGNMYIGDEYNQRVRKVSGVAGQDELISNTDGLSIYPNPCNGVFTFEVKTEEPGTKGDVNVYNMLGEKVYSSSFSTFHSPFSINLSTQPNGIYLVKVQSEDGAVMSKKVSILR